MATLWSAALSDVGTGAPYVEEELIFYFEPKQRAMRSQLRRGRTFHLLSSHPSNRVLCSAAPGRGATTRFDFKLFNIGRSEGALSSRLLAVELHELPEPRDVSSLDYYGIEDLLTDERAIGHGVFVQEEVMAETVPCPSGQVSGTADGAPS